MNRVTIGIDDTYRDCSKAKCTDKQRRVLLAPDKEQTFFHAEIYVIAMTLMQIQSHSNPDHRPLAIICSLQSTF
jgi:hypothetical protein